MINLIVKIFKVLNSDTDPGQISLAVCFALIMGLTPLSSPHNFLVLLLVFSLRVNAAAFFLAWPLMAGIGYMIDPILHRIGMAILTAPSMGNIWTVLYNNGFFRFERFNNSIVMGSLAVSLVLFIPCYFLSNFLIRRYRVDLLAWIEKTRLVKILKASKLWNVYKMVSGAGGM